jgi:hypothetical protein
MSACKEFQILVQTNFLVMFECRTGGSCKLLLCCRGAYKQLYSGRLVVLTGFAFSSCKNGLPVLYDQDT